MALHLALLVALVLAFLFWRYLLYPAFISPLSKIPTAHPIVSILPIWLWWKERKGCQARSIFEAHQRHGPVVRVGPNEVHLASLDGLRVAFNSGFDRSDWVLTFRNYNGTHNLFTMLDSKSHATRRRMVTRIYTKSYILDSADFQTLSQILLFERLVPVFDEAAKTGQGVEMYEILKAAGAEFVTAYQMGTENSLYLVAKGRERERKAYIEAGKIHMLELKGHKQAVKFLEDQHLEMCRNVEDMLTSTSSANKEEKSKANNKNRETQQVPQERSESASTFPVVYAQLRSSIPKIEGPKTPQETLYLIASELLDNLEPARDGIGGVLTYVLHELTLQPAIQSAIREELMTLEPPLSYPPGQNRISTSTLRKLDGLPLLNAVVMETLRLRSPFPIPFRRVVPEGGALIDGCFIPAGVVVGSSSYSLHMNPVAYPEPTKWNPKRWLDISDVATEQISISDHEKGGNGRASSNDPRRWFWAFGSGSRMCLGNNFALIGKSMEDVL
jgi:cytochrome P450